MKPCENTDCPYHKQLKNGERCAAENGCGGYYIKENK